VKLYNDVFPKIEDYIISSGKKVLNDQLNSLDSASCKIDSVDAKILFQVSSNEYNERYEQRIVTCDLDTIINRGSVVSDVKRVGFENIEDGTWIVISEIDINQISKYCKVQKCNQTLPFQIDGIIYTYPCIFEQSISVNSDGTDSGKLFPYGDEVGLITVQNNMATSQIPLNKRFIFDNYENGIWEVRSINKSQKKGLIEFKCVKSEKQATDRLDLNIANYVEPNDPTDDGYSITITGQDSIIANGSQATYIAKVFQDGVEVTNDVTWTLTDTNSLITTSTIVDKSCVLKANNTYKTGTVRLKCTMVDDESVLVEKIIMIKSLF